MSKVWLEGESLIDLEYGILMKFLWQKKFGKNDVEFGIVLRIFVFLWNVSYSRLILGKQWNWIEQNSKIVSLSVLLKIDFIEIRFKTFTFQHKQSQIYFFYFPKLNSNIAQKLEA